MPTYNYRCDTCGSRFAYARPIVDGPLEADHMRCIECGRWETVKRDYRADAVSIAAVPQSTYVPSLGMEISDQRQVDERLKHLTEDSFNRVGYEPRLRARHPSELASDPGHAEATEQAQRSTRDALD